MILVAWSTAEVTSHFNLIVKDVDAALRDIADAGGTVVGEAENGAKGRFGWFIDPDGNKVELWQPKLN